MTMLSISEANILAHEERTERTIDNEDSVRLVYNQTDPHTIRDGVDSITVAQQTEESYRIVYSGYLAGSLRVTADGIAELGGIYLTDRAEPLHWLLDATTVDDTNLPWWVPETLDLYPKLDCDRCDETTQAEAIVTPLGFQTETSADQFCRDCWDEIRDDY